MNPAAYQAQAQRAVQQIQYQQFQQNMARQFQFQFQHARTRSLAEVREQQQQAELKAEEQLAQFIQDQERQRQQQPAQDAAQALARQQADAKALNRLKVSTYREVFLPGQITTAQQSMHFSPGAQKQVESIGTTLLDKDWWSKQEATRLPGTLAAYGDTLSSLTAALLEFELTSPPNAPALPAQDFYEAVFATGNFDPDAAQQLIREAARAEKIESGARLAQAVAAFRALTTSAASATTPQQLQKSVQSSLQTINRELRQYDFRASGMGRLAYTQKALRKAATTYLAHSS